MIDYKTYCKHFKLNSDSLATARAYRDYCKKYKNTYRKYRQAEDEIRAKYRNNNTRDAVEKNALLAIINNDTPTFNRLIKIIKKRKKRGGLRVIR